MLADEVSTSHSNGINEELKKIDANHVQPLVVTDEDSNATEKVTIMPAGPFTIFPPHRNIGAGAAPCTNNYSIVLVLIITCWQDLLIDGGGGGGGGGGCCCTCMQVMASIS